MAEVGIDVTCVDIDTNKIEGLKKGVMPIYEPGLESMVVRNYEKGKLNFSTSLKESIKDSDVAFIAVGTPPDEDGSADLKYVLAVASEIGQHMNNYGVVVTKSTVPVGTAEKVRHAVKEALDKRGENIDFDIASNPEFLKEGAAIDDFMKPDRIVVGVDSDRAQGIMNKQYKPFIMNGHPLVFMDIPSACNSNLHSVSIKIPGSNCRTIMRCYWCSTCLRINFLPWLSPCLIAKNIFERTVGVKFVLIIVQARSCSYSSVIDSPPICVSFSWSNT